MTFPLIRISVRSVTPEQFIGLRFTLAALIFLPFILRGRATSLWARIQGELPGAAVLGAIAWVSYQTQTIGLETIAAGRAAFITGSCVLIVPLLSPFFGLGWPALIDWGASLFAAGGLFLVTHDGAAGPAASGISRGDLWVGACAVACAFYIQILQRLARTSADKTALSFTQVVTVAVLGNLSWVSTGAVFPPLSAMAIFSLIFCAIFATIGTFFLQTRYQGDTTAERAALIFTLEPVFGSVAGFLLLNERLGVSGFLGAALILGTIVVSETWKARG